MKGCQLNSLTHGSVRPFQAFIDLIAIHIVHTWACKAHNSSQCQNYFPSRTICRHTLSRILVNLASHLLKSFCEKELFATVWLDWRILGDSFVSLNLNSASCFVEGVLISGPVLWELHCRLFKKWVFLSKSWISRDHSLSRKTVNTRENFWNVYCFATNQMRDETAKEIRQTAALTRNNELAFSSTRNLQFYRFQIVNYFFLSPFWLW